MARLVPSLGHLPPPRGFGPIRLDRFSPNFVEAEVRGFVNVRPLPPYRHIYPLPEAALANLAYYFDHDDREPRDVAGYTAPLVRALERWRREASRSELVSEPAGDRLLVWDLRPGARDALVTLQGPERALYEACDAAADARTLARAAGCDGPEAVHDALGPLVDQGLMVRDGSRYLALALSLSEYALPAWAGQRRRELALDRGRPALREIVPPTVEGNEVVPPIT